MLRAQIGMPLSLWLLFVEDDSRNVLSCELIARKVGLDSSSIVKIFKCVVRNEEANLLSKARDNQGSIIMLSLVEPNAARSRYKTRTFGRT